MVRVSDIELPVVLKDKLLFAPGVWNNWDIQGAEISKAYESTDWTSKRNRALYFEHKDNDSEKWTGNVINQRIIDDKLYGDIEVWDMNTAIKLGRGEAPFAISAMISWPAIYDNPTNFTFNNFSLVANPGVQLDEMFINFSDETEGEKKVKFYIQENLESDERRSNLNNKMEQELNKSSAEFSIEDFKALADRVSTLETAIAKFSEEEATEEPAKEEAVEEVEEVKEEVVEEKEEEVVEEEKSEETAEEVEAEEEVTEEVEAEEEEAEKAEFSEEEVEAEEPKEEVEEVEEESEEAPAKEDATEEEEKTEEATFSSQVQDELSILKQGFGGETTPISSVNTNKAKFSDAVNRLEKEF